ncbi:hypothetical protein GCM10008101_22120 [Lysobacter xinjiangensis]|uniref:DUF2782 domain-containing protein n=1 Tax=Cognatilysobacter xinjiangensis TaxID=546892 RepID=A0ABQ3C7Z3_9GAMM|nr:DUF2782 domain-containing protein [Lysobacter xinjiangensis]GGZ67448.1 hypothetical protein GCM10008101_22120 [Lysobacter xinjiangensis]
MPRLIPLALGLAVLAGCASMAAVDDPTLALADADVVTRTLENGDTVSEYRVAGLLRVVKIVPRHGVTYYLTDDDNDGRLDGRRGEGPITPVQYKILSW